MPFLNVSCNTKYNYLNPITEKVLTFPEIMTKCYLA